MTVFIALLAAAILYLVIRNHKVKSPSTARTAEPEPSSPSGAHHRPIPVFHWEDDENFDFEVVGESHYQDTLRRLAGDHGDESAAVTRTALLIPEDSNKHDNKAVAVYIDDHQVGYLSREDARSFRRRLGRKKLTGQATSARAQIKGGGVSDNRRYSYGVWLDMKPFN